MAIDDIKKHIQEKAQQEIAIIKADAQKEAHALETTWEKKIKEEKERIIETMKKNAQSKLAQVSFKIKEKVHAQELKAKQSQLDKVYESALSTIADLPKADYVLMMEKLLSPLAEKEGVIHTSQKRRDELELAAQHIGCKAQISQKNIETVGGFIFEGEKTEIDNRFETVMKQVQEQTIIQTHKTLFNA